MHLFSCTKPFLDFKLLLISSLTYTTYIKGSIGRGFHIFPITHFSNCVCIRARIFYSPPYQKSAPMYTCRPCHYCPLNLCSFLIISDLCLLKTFSVGVLTTSKFFLELCLSGLWLLCVSELCFSPIPTNPENLRSGNAKKDVEPWKKCGCWPPPPFFCSK